MLFFPFIFDCYRFWDFFRCSGWKKRRSVHKKYEFNFILFLLTLLFICSHFLCVLVNSRTLCQEEKGKRKGGRREREMRKKEKKNVVDCSCCLQMNWNKMEASKSVRTWKKRGWREKQLLQRREWEKEKSGRERMTEKVIVVERSLELCDRNHHR